MQLRRAISRVTSLLLNNGADVNVLDKMWKSPLIVAGEKGRDDMLQLLLNRGAGVNGTAGQNKTVLILSAFNGYDKCVNVLLKAGADVNYSDTEGYTALMHASIYGHHKFVRLLLNAGADVNLEDCHENTALQLATGSYCCLQLLIQAGADVNKRNYYGISALFTALTHENTACVKLLLKAGIQINRISDGGQHALDFYLSLCNSPNRKLCTLLYSAGEKVSTTTVTKSGRVSRTTSRSRKMSAFLLLKDRIVSLDLQGLCRDVIRQHLIDIQPYENLFVRVPQLPLPSAVLNYLLYNMSLEMKEDKYDNDSSTVLPCWWSVVTK